MSGLWEAEELSWWPSWSNSLWQGWSCGLVHCASGNASDPIWRVLASSDGISSWTPFKKPQHSIPRWLSVQWEPSTCRSCQCCKKKGDLQKFVDGFSLSGLLWVRESQHASTGNSVSWSLGHSSRSSFHRMAFFPSLKHNFIVYRSSKVQIAFLKFASCDNQALLGCIPIPSVDVSFEPEIIKIDESSHKMYCNNIHNFQEFTTILNACTKKYGNLLNPLRNIVSL